MTGSPSVSFAPKWPMAAVLRRLRTRIELQGALGLMLWLALVFVVVRAGNG